MQKYPVFILFLCSVFCLHGQDNLDTSSQRDDSRLRDLNWAADTVFGAFKSTRFTNMKIVYPSFKTYKLFIDTSEAGAQSSVTQYAMYNTFWNRIRIQYTKMMKKAARAGIKWENTTLDSVAMDTGYIGSHEYVYMYWFVKHKQKKRYKFSALFLKMKNKWYLIDELKYEGLVVDKKKKKNVKRSRRD